MEGAGAEPDTGRLGELLAPLRESPERSAVLIDVDGTIAPIVDRPGDAGVGGRTQALLRELAGRYGLVACVSGRRATDARLVVGLDQLAYSGNHGYELLMPGEAKPHPDPSLAGHERDAARFVAGLDASSLERAGVRVEDKAAIVALHWRGAPDEGTAESLAKEIAAEAERRGLVTHRGRKVLEIRPDVPINKGLAVAALISSAPVTAALYGGDDLTDVDAFEALRALRGDGALKAVTCVAVGSGETPPEVSAAADITVEGTEGFNEVLRALAA